jgi:transcriptional regulator with XRE-family HTH domain
MLAGMTTSAEGRTGPSLSKRVAAEIRAEMARQQVTQNALAKKLGVTQPWLWRRVKGDHPISLDDLELIGQGLDMQPEQLIDRAIALRSTVTGGYPPTSGRSPFGARPPSYPAAHAMPSVRDRRPFSLAVVG